MRLLTLAAVLAAAAICASAPSSAVAQRVQPCDIARSLVAPRLPASLTIRTRCGAYRIDRSGHVRRVSSNPSPVPGGASWWPYTGVWDKVASGRLLVGRWERELWRSSGHFPVAYRVDALAVGPRALAFSYGWRPGELYIAPLDGRERPIASGEFPLGWTSGGLYTHRTRGGELLLRSRDGNLRATLARHNSGYVYDREDGSLYFLAHGALIRAHGASKQAISQLAKLDLRPRGSLQLEPLGGLIALHNAHRLVILHPNGSLFAAISLPQPKTRVDGVSSMLALSPSGDSVAFTATRGNTAAASTGSETVYLLHAGARSAKPIHRERLTFAVCERAAQVAWRGRWLLYSASEGNLTLVDTRHPQHAIALADVLRRLPGTNGEQGGLNFTAYWTGDPTGV